MVSDPISKCEIIYRTSKNIKFRRSVATIHKNSLQLAFDMSNHLTYKYKPCRDNLYCIFLPMLIHSFSIPHTFSCFLFFCQIKGMGVAIPIISPPLDPPLVYKRYECSKVGMKLLSLSLIGYM